MSHAFERSIPRWCDDAVIVEVHCAVPNVLKLEGAHMRLGMTHKHKMCSSSPYSLCTIYCGAFSVVFHENFLFYKNRATPGVNYFL